MSTPKRIASLLASATEILYGIGVGDRVVAVSHECDYPAQVVDKPRVTCSRIDSHKTSDQIDTDVRQRLAAGEPLYEVDWPLLESLAPDLIVTQAQCDVCAVRYGDVVDAVASRASLRNTQVAALNPNSIADVLRDIQRMGQWVGESAAADQFGGRLRRRIDTIQQATTALTMAQRPRAVCIEWTQPLMLAGNWMPELVEMAGARCELSTPGSASVYVDWPDIVALDPEIIIIAPCGFDLARSQEVAHRLLELPGWQDTAAARAGRTYTVDGNAYFNRSGPRLVDSLAIMGHLFHPSLFEIPLPVEQWDQTVALFSG